MSFMLSVTNSTIMLNVVAPLNIIQANHFSEHALLPMLPGTAFTASLVYKGLLNALQLAYSCGIFALLVEESGAYCLHICKIRPLPALQGVML